MKLKFDPNLQFQIDAVDSMVDVFDGQPLSEGDLEIGFKREDYIFQTELGIANNLVLDSPAILKNVRLVQERNDIEPGPSLRGMHFSVEMETGTGKTYVYLRTIFELHKKYGFKKYVIVVPSVAIREGVLKNLEITKSPFLHLPIGTYNPDWAIVKHGDDTLYLVRETKGVKDFEKLRNVEADRIRCARKHFEELQVDFKTVVAAGEV